MEVIRLVQELFEEHTPETLMALFGSITSILLFYLVWSLQRQLFGLQRIIIDQDGEQEQSTASVVDALVTALITEFANLRRSMDEVLRQAVQFEMKNAEMLSHLVERTGSTPGDVLSLLTPEFDGLRSDLREVEQRILARMPETRVEEAD